MKTLIIGAGHGCKEILGLEHQAFLSELNLETIAVVDVNEQAPGMVYARENNIKTYTSWELASSENDFELIIELTGSDVFLEDLYKRIPAGIRLIDHKMAHIFWDLINAQEEKKNQLDEIIKLDSRLQNEKRFLQSVFNGFDDLAVVIDLNKMIVRANSKFYSYISKTQDETVGKSCCDVLIGSTLCKQMCNENDFYTELIEKRKPIYQLVTANEPNEVHFEVIRTPIFDDSGNIEYILIVWHKITDRVKLSREVQMAESKFRSFIDSAQDWISIKDLEGRYLIVNPVIARAYDKQPEDFVGKTAEETLPYEMVDYVNQHDEEVRQSGIAKMFNEEVWINNLIHHFQIVRFPLNDWKGNIIGTCAIGRDVTNETHLQEQLMQSEKLAALGKLSAGVAHEINNPLTGILAFAEDMRDNEALDSELRNDINVIIRETLRCRDIVKHLLDYSRQDKPTLNDENLNETVEMSLDLLRKLPQFRDITIDKKLSSNIPPVLVDFKQVEQVLLNLFINAADAMSYKGNIVIRTGIRKNEYAFVEIQDSGPGIPDNLKSKVFEPFFSTKNTSGLGLAVCKGIIERHGGNLLAISSADSGATFIIELPIPNYHGDKHGR